MRAVVVGDLVVEVDGTVPYAFTDLTEDQLTYAPLRFDVGGTASNFSRAAVELFDEVTVVGCVGADAMGDVVIDQLTRAGITCDVSRASEHPTALAVYLRDASSTSPKGVRHLVIGSPSANQAFGPEEARHLIGAAADADFVVTDCYSMMSEPRRSHLLGALEQLATAPAKVVVDLVPHDCWRIFSQDDVDRFAAPADILIAEVRTVLAFAGEPFTAEADLTAARRAAAQVQERWPTATCFLRFGHGNCDESLVVQPGSDPQVYETGYRSTTVPRGFGDRLTAHELHALHRGLVGVQVT